MKKYVPSLGTIEEPRFEYVQILKGSRPCVLKTYQCLVIQKVLVTPLARFSRLVKSFVDIQECYMISLWYIIHLRHKKIWLTNQEQKQTKHILLMTCMWEGALKYGYTGNEANLKYKLHSKKKVNHQLACHQYQLADPMPSAQMPHQKTHTL